MNVVIVESLLASDLTPAQKLVAAATSNSKPFSVTNVAKALNMDRVSVYRALDALVAKAMAEVEEIGNGMRVLRPRGWTDAGQRNILGLR